MSDELKQLPPIDAHKQWSGGQWVNYRTLQPNLPCEYADHRTCKTLSVLMEAQRAADLKTKADELAAAEQAKVAQLADQKVKDDAQRLIDTAAQLRADAQRSAFYDFEQAKEKARQAAADRIAKAQAAAAADISAANADLAAACTAAQTAYEAAAQAVQTTNWKAKAQAQLHPPAPAAPTPSPAAAEAPTAAPAAPEASEPPAAAAPAPEASASSPAAAAPPADPAPSSGGQAN